MENCKGYVVGVNGNLVTVRFTGSIRKNEVGYVLLGDTRLKGEVIRVNGETVSMQIYEMTNGVKVGDELEFTGGLMTPAPMQRHVSHMSSGFALPSV